MPRLHIDLNNRCICPRHTPLGKLGLERLEYPEDDELDPIEIPVTTRSLNVTLSIIATSGDSDSEYTPGGLTVVAKRGTELAIFHYGQCEWRPLALQAYQKGVRNF